MAAMFCSAIGSGLYCDWDAEHISSGYNGSHWLSIQMHNSISGDKLYTACDLKER